jgi:hypothetical protein
LENTGMPEPGKKFAMIYLDTMIKLSGTAEGRTKFMVYCFLRAEYGNIQHGEKHPPGQHNEKCGKHWFYASWNDIADRLGMCRATVKHAARSLQKDDLLDIKAHTHRSAYPSDRNFMRVKPYLVG